MHFYHADKDMGGTLDISEVPAALYACGYQLPPMEVHGYVQKHATGCHLNFLQFMALVLDLQSRSTGLGVSIPAGYGPAAGHGAVGAHGISSPGSSGNAGKKTKGGKGGKSSKKAGGKGHYTGRM